MNLLLIKVVLLSFCIYFANTEKNAKVKIIPAAYMQKIEDVILYESHAKIVFKVKLPEYHPFQEKSNYWWQQHGIQSRINSVVEELFLDSYKEMGFNHPKEVVLRPKRQLLVAGALAAGFFIHSVFSKTSKELFGQEDQITSYVNRLQKAVQEEDQKFYVMKENIESYASKLTNFQKFIVTRLKEQNQLGFINSEHIIELYRILLFKIEHDYLVHSVDACKRKEIPSKLITSAQLLSSLTKLSNSQSLGEKELAIPLHQLSTYFKLPIYDCFFSPSHATVILSVPLKRKSNDYLLYKIHHHKFAFHGQTCSLYPSEASYLATSRDKSLLITKHLLEECSVNEHKLCLIPEFSYDSSESLDCAVGILNNKASSELQNICAFRCSHSTELSISQVEDSKLIITNSNEIKITCNNGEQVFKFPKLGAVELNLDCHYTVFVDGNIKIRPFYCLEPSFANEPVYITFPTIWSKLSDSFGSTSHVFLQLSNSTFDEQWNEKIPVLNLTMQKQTIIPDQIGPLPTHHFLMLWLFINTVILVIILGCVYCMLKPYMRQ